MSIRLENKVAAVAGAAWGGIGGARAYRFALEGASVVISTRRRKDKLMETVSRLHSGGGQAVPVMGDVADESPRQEMVAAAVDQLGQVPPWCTTQPRPPAKRWLCGTAVWCPEGRYRTC